MDNVFVLYDRKSDSVWYPLGESRLHAVSGARRGDSIQILDEPSPLALGEWLSLHPQSLILLPTPEDLERIQARASQPYLGVRFEERDDALFLGDVMEGTPADLAGLRPGDKILRMADRSVVSRKDFASGLEGYAPGDPLDLLVLRRGTERSIEVVLGRR